MVPLMLPGLPADKAEPPCLAQPLPGPSRADSEFPSAYHLCKFYFKETQTHHLQIISIGDNFGVVVKEMREEEGKKAAQEVKSRPRPHFPENDLSQVL